MLVYRIAKSLQRASDISAIGSFTYGGRWNSKGTYMLYTSMNSSLAYLENLVHFDESNRPPDLYITTIDLQINDKLIYELPDAKYPPLWHALENLENKLMGDKWMLEKKYLAFKVRSAINPAEYNYLLNPLYSGYHDIVKVQTVQSLPVDSRLVR